MATSPTTGTQIPETFLKHMKDLVIHLTGDHIHRIYLLWALKQFSPSIPVTVGTSMEFCAILMISDEHRRLLASLMLIDPYLRPSSCPIDDVLKMTKE